jgi:hypothetical protein
MGFESWFLLLIVTALCGGREFWFWLRFSSKAIERGRHLTAADSGSFARSLGALQSRISLDRGAAPVDSLEVAARDEAKAALASPSIQSSRGGATPK